MHRLKGHGASLLTAALLLFGFGAVTLVSTPAFAQGCGGITVVSHKTGGVYAPDNSIQGIQYAGSVGVKAMEIDLVFNKSNFAWASHEDDLSKRTNAPAGTLISNLWMPDIQKYSAANTAPWSTDARFAGFNADGTPKTRVPYTYDILYHAQRANIDTIHFDVKMVPTRAQIDNFLGYLDRPEFAFIGSKKHNWGGSIGAVKAMQAVAGSRFTYDIGESQVDNLRTGGWMKTNGLNGYAAPNYRIDKPAVDYWKAYGIRVGAWATNYPENDTPTEWLRLKEIGVQYFATDHPKQAIEALCTPDATPSTPVEPSETTPSTPSGQGGGALKPVRLR